MLSKIDDSFGNKAECIPPLVYLGSIQTVVVPTLELGSVFCDYSRLLTSNKHAWFYELTVVESSDGILDLVCKYLSGANKLLHRNAPTVQSFGSKFTTVSFEESEYIIAILVDSSESKLRSIKINTSCGKEYIFGPKIYNTTSWNLLAPENHAIRSFSFYKCDNEPISGLEFHIQKLKTLSVVKSFCRVSDFDENGIVYWIGI